MRKRIAKPRRVQQLHDCYVPDDYIRRIKVTQGRVKLQYHKGTIQLTTSDPSVISGQAPAWLEGEDFDKLITALREGKRVWLKAFRRTERELQRLAREKKRGKR